MFKAYFDHLFLEIDIGLAVMVAGGWATAKLLSREGLRWTWAWLGIPLAFLLSNVNVPLSLPLWGATLFACWWGASWHKQDVMHGADFAENARARVGVVDVIRTRQSKDAIKRDGWLKGDSLIVGRDTQGLPVSIPAGRAAGKHTLILGATGSGKTVSEAWIAGRLIESGRAAIVIDPKGDQMLRSELMLAAQRRGARFREWTPEGPLAYNPYAQGTDTEIADKALSGEEFTEPHYLRQAQRYLGHAVRVMRSAGVPVTPASLMAHMDPRELEVSARRMPEQEAGETQAYLDSLTDRQKRDLAGVRDRLSILAESDAREWLAPNGAGNALDIHEAIRDGDVVYFRLDSDRRLLFAQMLAAAIVSDLITLVARMQQNPLPTLVLIDEFSALAAEQVSRLFARGRSAGISLILATQELADLTSVGDGALRDQTLGNVSSVIAHRQNVPESAELIASTAGTRAAWVTTQQTETRLVGSSPSGRGSRRRGYEYEVHPGRIKQLSIGQAVVITPGSGRPAVTQMCHPTEARR